MYSPYNSYDQYEVAVPLSRAADCLAALSSEVYARQLWHGFRVPALLQLVAGDTFHLSPSNRGPQLYLNLEGAAPSCLRSHPSNPVPRASACFVRRAARPGSARQTAVRSFNVGKALRADCIIAAVWGQEGREAMLGAASGPCNSLGVEGWGHWGVRDAHRARVRPGCVPISGCRMGSCGQAMANRGSAMPREGQGPTGLEGCSFLPMREGEGGGLRSAHGARGARPRALRRQLKEELQLDVRRRRGVRQAERVHGCQCVAIAFGGPAGTDSSGHGLGGFAPCRRLTLSLGQARAERT